MSQLDKLFNLLYDLKPHRSDEITEMVCGNEHLGLFRLSARILNLKEKGYSINGWHDPDKRTLYWYQLTSRLPTKPLESQAFKGKVFIPEIRVKPIQLNLIESSGYTDY